MHWRTGESGTDSQFKELRRRKCVDAMSREEWEQALVRAVVERGFRARLLADPADALADYGLGESHQPLVASMRASTLSEFASRMLHLAVGIWDTTTPAVSVDGDYF
jgi:hypothetical protein